VAETFRQAKSMLDSTLKALRRKKEIIILLSIKARMRELDELVALLEKSPIAFHKLLYEARDNV